MRADPKSKKRILEKYSFYKSNSHFNNVIYVFPVKRMYQTYIEVLRENSKTIPSDFFLFLYCPQMFQRNFDLLKSEVTYKYGHTTLENLFLIEVEYECNDSRTASNSFYKSAPSS